MTPLREEDDMLAAEYALGVLDAADRAAAEARAATDPAFAAAIARWQDQLSPLNAGYAEVAPPARVRQNIEQRLFPTTAAPRHRFALWGGLAGLALAASVVVGVLVLQPPEPAAPQLQAALAADGAPVAFAAAWDGQSLAVTRVSGAAAAPGQDYQLWLIGPSGVPESLGLLGDGDTLVTRADLAPGLVLAVSVEPAGGSPLPTPTGPVILTAALALP
jgi:anti-sigma-K factor RskA